MATSGVPRPAFGNIVAAAKEKRERDEYDRLSTLFRNAKELCDSPSGRPRRRPTLCDLRKVHEVTIPLSKEQSAISSTMPFSPHKSLVRPASTVDLLG